MLQINPMPYLMPCQFNTCRDFSGSVLKDAMLETVVRGIIIHCRSVDDDKWLPFTYSEYVMSILPRCATREDKAAFGTLVARGLLKSEDGKYLVTDELTSDLFEFSILASRGFPMPA